MYCTASSQTFPAILASLLSSVLFFKLSSPSPTCLFCQMFLDPFSNWATLFSHLVPYHLASTVLESLSSYFPIPPYYSILSQCNILIASKDNFPSPNKTESADHFNPLALEVSWQEKNKQTTVKLIHVSNKKDSVMEFYIMLAPRSSSVYMKSQTAQMHSLLHNWCPPVCFNFPQHLWEPFCTPLPSYMRREDYFATWREDGKPARHFSCPQIKTTP